MTTCPSCGDALAQRDSIGGLAIVGVTTLDPALEAYDARPLHIPLPVPSAAGPVSGVASAMSRMATLAGSYATRTDLEGPADPDAVGTPTDAALRAVELLDDQERRG